MVFMVETDTTTRGNDMTPEIKLQIIADVLNAADTNHDRQHGYNPWEHFQELCAKHSIDEDEERQLAEDPEGVDTLFAEGGWNLHLSGGEWHVDAPAAETTKTYLVWDVNRIEVQIDAETAEKAAEEYVSEGTWGHALKTSWVTVTVLELGADPDEACDCTVTLDPDEPICTHDDGHDWQQPVRLVGGCEESPGVRGHGGGIIDTEICLRCGYVKHLDTWAQNPETGEQGLRSVEYCPDDERLQEYLDDLDVGTLDQEEVAEGGADEDGDATWQTFIAADDVTGRFAAVVVEGLDKGDAAETHVEWCFTPDEARQQCEEWAEGLRMYETN
jgi:hypothetical protein